MKKNILILIVVIVVIAGFCAFVLQQKAANKTNSTVKIPSTQIISSTAGLTPMQVVQGYLDADMAGAGWLGSDLNPQSKDKFLLSSDDNDDLALGSITRENITMVTKKYNIVNESQSQDKSKTYVKVNFYCDKILFSGVLHLKGEQALGASDASGGEPTFALESCSEFFRNQTYYYLGCADENTDKTANPNDHTFDCKTNIETINFRLIKKDSGWGINGPVFENHISEGFLNTWLKQ
jgi:hypothetical protein